VKLLLTELEVPIILPLTAFPRTFPGWVPTRKKSLLITYSKLSDSLLRAASEGKLSTYYLHFPERVFSASLSPTMVRKLIIYFQFSDYMHCELPIHNALI